MIDEGILLTEESDDDTDKPEPVPYFSPQTLFV